MSRASAQRVVYALHNRRLVPKTEIVTQGSGVNSPEPGADIAVEELAELVQESAERPTLKLRGRPPKQREDNVSDFTIEG